MSANMRNGNMRNGNKWTVNEVLALQREYELLEWTIQEISAKHKRSIGSILFKLTAEGFIPSWNDARGYNMEDYAVSVLCQGALCDNDYDNDDDEDYVDEEDDEDDADEDDDDYDDDDMSSEDVCSYDADQGWNLRESVTEIGNMVKQIFQVMSASKQKSGASASSSAM
jgi:hypothetical protein